MSTELSGRMAAVASWLTVIGILLYITFWAVFPKSSWLAYFSGLLIVSGFLLALYADWRTGNHASVRRRLIIFIVVVLAAVLIYFWRSNG